jgi:hypothetical protein
MNMKLCGPFANEIGNRQLAIGNGITLLLRVESQADNLEGSTSMPEKRGIQATEEVKAEWSQAYKIYLKAPGDRYDKKKDRTSRIDFVAQEMKLTRKQAKRRIRNFEAWQRNIKKGLVTP